MPARAHPRTSAGSAATRRWPSGGGAASHPSTHRTRGVRVEELRDWLPVDWHPDHFDLRQVNKALAALGPGEGDLVLATLPEPLRKLVERLPPDDRDQVDEWLGADPWTDALEPLPDAAVALTECFRVVLDVVGDGVTLTGAGYLPPGTVKEIFVRLGLDEESALVSLLAVAGGDGFHGGPGGRRAGTGRVATILTAAGWRSDRGDAVTAAQVRDVAAHTLATLEHMVRGVATDDEGRAHAEWIACTALDGDAANT